MSDRWVCTRCFADNEETVAEGDRAYLCYLYEPDPADVSKDLTLTTSLRGAAR